MLAHCWQDAVGFPSEVETAFLNSGYQAFSNLKLLLALPEHKVLLKGRGPESQNDLYVLAKNESSELVSISIEGKVSEPFGVTLGEWNDGSANRQVRLNYLIKMLGLTGPLPGHIRYQLLHRTASAVIEAHRFTASHAVMLIHSFSQQHENFDDYQEFVALYGKTAGTDELVWLCDLGSVHLYVGWVTGDSVYLKR